MIEGNKISAVSPKSWKKAFNSAVVIPVIPAKMRFCNECLDKIICDRSNNQINGVKKFEVIFTFIEKTSS